MSTRPTVLLAPHFRTLEEIFDPRDLERLASFSEVVWARDEPLPEAELDALLPEAWAYIGTSQPLDAARLATAPKLRAVIEVAGGFPPSIDYQTCFARGIRVLSCAPAFGAQVAEMALAMALAGGRGLVREHEAFRRGDEVWQVDRPAWDSTLFGQQVGLLGFGSLAQNLLPLLAPFGCHIRVFDPWLPPTLIEERGCQPTDLDDMLTNSRVLFVLATPTPENRALLSAEKLALLPDRALVVLISRAHLVDFEALTEAVTSGKLQAAIDVFPSEEPFTPNHPIRTAATAILSPHRAASSKKERREIGRMVVDDLELMERGLPPRRLQVAEPEIVMRRLGKRS